MSLSDLASLGSFVSGVAVVVTFVFLLLQMRQTNRNLRAQMQQGRSARLIQNASLLANPYLGDLLVRASRGDLDFTAVEVSSYIRMSATWFWSWEDSFYQHEIAALDDTGWRSDLSQLRSSLTDPGSRTAWRLLRRYAGGPYADFVDKLMKETASAEVPDISQTWRIIMTEEIARAHKA